MEEEKEFENAGWIIAGMVIGFILLIITLVGGIVITPAGHNNVVLTFGKVDGVKQEGLSFKMPIFQSVKTMSIQTQLFEVKDTMAASKDLQDVKTSIAINYKLNPAYVGEIYRTLGLNYIERLAHPAIQEIVKATTARWNAEDLITKRESVKDEIAASLKTRLGERGIIVELVNITNFEFSREFTAAIEAKVVAVQRVQEAENKLKQIEVEARQAEAKAKGEAAAAIARAEGQVKAAQIMELGLTDKYLQYMYIDKLASTAQVIIVPEGMPMTFNR